MATEPTDLTPMPAEASPIHWSAIEAGVDDDGETTVRSNTQMAAHFAAMTVAHMCGYQEEMNALRGSETRTGVRRAVDRHLHPGLAAFTAAAALHGWSASKIDDAIEDGATVDEWAWQWLHETGLTQAQIERLTHDLNAPGVIENLAKENAQ